MSRERHLWSIFKSQSSQADSVSWFWNNEPAGIVYITHCSCYVPQFSYYNIHTFYNYTLENKHHWIIHWILEVKCAHICWTLSSQVWRCQLQPALQLLCVVLLHVLHECSCVYVSTTSVLCMNVVVCMFLLHRWFIKIWECWPSRSLSTQLSAVFSSQ